MKSRTVLGFALFAILLTFAVRAAAQAPAVRVTNLPGGQTLAMIFYRGPKGTTPPVNVTVNANGPIAALQGLLGPGKPHIAMRSWVCHDPNGNVIIISLPVADGNPCPDGKEIGGLWYLDNPNPPIFDLSPGNYSVSQEGNVAASPTTSNTSAACGAVPMSSFTPMIELRGFGGASIVNGNTPGTAGFDGAVLFPLGNRILIGPTAGFQWVGSSIVNSIGSHQPGSTFINTSVGFKGGNFGGEIQFPLFKETHHRHPPFYFGIHGGVTVAGSTIAQQSGFCGNGTPTGGPAGCTVFSSTGRHDTVVGPFVGGYISHPIFSRVSVFVGYDYLRLKDTTAAGTTGSSTGGKQTIFDTHGNIVVGGLILTFGRHH